MSFDLSNSQRLPPFPRPNQLENEASQLIARWNGSHLTIAGKHASNSELGIIKTHNKKRCYSDEQLHTIVRNDAFESAVFIQNFYVKSSFPFINKLNSRFPFISKFNSKFPSINKRNSDGDTLLSTALNFGHEHTVDALLHRGANPNKKCKNSNFPLHLAVERQKLPMIKMLLNGENGRKKADLCARNGDGETALDLAMKKGNTEIVQYLRGPSTNYFNCPFPLHTAVLRQDLPMIKSLLNGENGRKKADLCARNKYGETALHIAVEGGDLEIVRYLLAHGASAKAKNHDGMTPLQLANARVCDGLNTREKLRAEFRRFENSATFGNRLRTWFQNFRSRLRRSLRRE